MCMALWMPRQMREAGFQAVYNRQRKGAIGVPPSLWGSEKDFLSKGDLFWETWSDVILGKLLAWVRLCMCIGPGTMETHLWKT